MTKNSKRDLVALVLMALIIGIVFAFTWASRAVNDTTPNTDLIDAAESLQNFVNSYHSLSPVQLSTAEGGDALDPKVYKSAAARAPDVGTANELRYVAELVTKYNKGAGVETLEEANLLLVEVLTHISKTTTQ